MWSCFFGTGGWLIHYASSKELALATSFRVLDVSRRNDHRRATLGARSGRATFGARSGFERSKGFSFALPLPLPLPLEMLA
jgi:hypothetical protein